MHVPHTHSTDFKGKLSCMFYQQKKTAWHAFSHWDGTLKQSAWFGCWTWAAWMCVWWLANEPIGNLIEGSECFWHIVSRLHTGGRLYGWIGVWSTVNFCRHTGANGFFLFVRIWRSNLKQQRLQVEWLELVKKHYVCKSILLHQSWTYLWI